MATLVLGAIGGAIGGPVGAAIGSALGNAIDRRVLSPSRRREGPRLGDLAVQGSSYGEAIPRLYGMNRVAGQVIWSTGLVETVRTSGGGKRSGGRTTSYSYAASFAVSLAAREIVSVKRIWADGKLLRGSDGGLLFPCGALRVHRGTEAQAPDALIAAAEGPGGAPAYRGLAYAVFEDLQLADFANRVPNLTFEVEADEGPVTAGTVVADLFAAAGAAAPETDAAGGGIAGFAVGRAASLRSVLETLDRLVPLSMGDDGTRLTVTAGVPAAVTVPAGDLGGATGRGVRVRATTRRGAAEALPGEMAVGFADPARDYQPGLQRARRRGGAASDATDLPATLSAGAAKACAERMLREAWAARTTGEIALPWRQARLSPGDAVRIDGVDWRVRGWTMEGLSVALEVERMPDLAAATVLASDGGRANVDVDAPHGPTVLEVLDLPPIGAELPTTARLWLAAAGPEVGWRRAELLVSADGGATFASIGAANGQATMGSCVTALAEGPDDRWDRGNSVEVELLSDAMWLEGRSEASVLAGANLAVIGDELVQFASAVAIAPRRFRLSGLLRGRRGSRSVSHAAGARLVLIDPATLTPFDAPLSAVGGTLSFKAMGPGDVGGGIEATVAIAGRALRPLAPCHVSARRVDGGDIRIDWVRRSRQGFDWLDGADAPLGEERERYAVEVSTGAGSPRRWETGAASVLYAFAEQAADIGGAVTSLSVRLTQSSALAGPGDAALQQFEIAV